MVRRTSRADADDRPVVRISDTGELAAAVPHLLGFRPTESLVLIGLGGPSGGGVGLTARTDLPPPGYAAEVARAVAHRVATDEPRIAVAVVVSEAPDEAGPEPDLPHRVLVHEVLGALTELGLPLGDALLVRGGRWWSYDCPYPCCAPERGTPLPGGVSELAVASVAAGAVLADDRNGLVARIAPLTGSAAADMASACHLAMVAGAARLLDGDKDGYAAESWSAILAAARRCAPGVSGRLADAEVARILCGLRDVAVRDRALGLAIGPEPAAAEALWTECTRRAPAPLAAAPATLLAVSVWLRGDGAMANVALERALQGDPAYRFAGQLIDALAACVPPQEIRELVAATSVDADDVWPAT